MFNACILKADSVVKEVKEYDFIDHTSGEVLITPRLKSISKYNRQGLMLESKIYETSGEVKVVTKYDYNDKLQCIAISYYNEKGEKISEEEKRFDEKGSTIPFLIVKSSDFCKQISPQIKCSYDKNGNVIEAIKYDETIKDMIVIKISYKYQYW